MDVTVGTFNLNNLFSRWNFKAEISEIPEGERDVRLFFEFDEDGSYRFRQFMGRLITAMPEDQRKDLAERITRMDLDVLAVQEAEDIEALKDFARVYLPGLYPNAVLIEGNDSRFIDVGVLSKRDFPIGAVTSWQHETHAADPSERMFARDLLEVETLDSKRKRRLGDPGISGGLIDRLEGSHGKATSVPNRLVPDPVEVGQGPVREFGEVDSHPCGVVEIEVF